MIFWHPNFVRLALGLIVGYALGRASKCEDGANAAAGDSSGGAESASAKASTRSATSERDDLTRIEGIGPKIRGILQAEGIATFRALAKTPTEKLESILAAAGGRYRMHDPGTWPEQAALAAAGRDEDLEALKSELEGGRRG